MANFFVNRPILASVISIVITLAGLVAAHLLPIAQYPEIAPPSINITAYYPGASAETLIQTVVAPIEEQLNGIEGLTYFNSSSDSNGATTITATFNVGTDSDLAAINVSNRVKLAEPRLPAAVRTNGVIVEKGSNDILSVVAINAPGGEYDSLFLSNYASLNIVDELKRLPGVGNVIIFGAQDYSMRIWLKTDRMAQLGITVSDITHAIQGQNAQNAAGKIGSNPAAPGQMLIYTVNAKGRLQTPEDFGNIMLRAEGAEGILYLKDVATIELGAQSYDAHTTLDGKPTVALAVFLQTGANALNVADSVEEAMKNLALQFPQGVEYLIPFDTTQFVRASIEEVIHTLAEAAILVLLVVFLFLQNWRATLIPIIAVPVSLIGTFAGLWLCGFSINTLTLFAMVLAVGIVVDDAIVVLENVERLMTTKNLSPKDATIEAMREVSGAVIAIVLVLCSVFIPVAFLGGIAGKLYQQFAVTIAISVVISGIVALTLTPALCALLLKPHVLHWSFFTRFNHLLAGLTHFYTDMVTRILHHRKIGIAGLLSVCLACVGLFYYIPKGFAPSEDQGYLFSMVLLPDGATLERTSKVGETLRQIFAQDPSVEHVFVVSGFDFMGGGTKSNVASMFVNLAPWDERAISSEMLAQKFMGQGMMLSDAIGLTFNPPPIRGLGNAGGVELYIQDRLGSNPQKLAEVMNTFIGALHAQPTIANTNTFFRPSVPQLFVEVDETKALSLGIDLREIYETLQVTAGPIYVNDFNKAGRAYQVQVQADIPYRMDPADLGKAYVRARTGGMIPLSVVIDVHPVLGPEQLERFNGFMAGKIYSSGAPGISSGAVMHTIESVAAKTLPPGYTLAWTNQALQEKNSSGSSNAAFGFAIIMVFLILAALYEQWSLPMAVILAVPFGLFGALFAILWRGIPNDIFFQIGLITLIGLSCKNAILIVEFAIQEYQKGLSAIEAAIEATRLRFRPILMTSLAFILGIVPLLIASGAGAGARRSMGTGVFGGMLLSTFIATMFVPVFFKWLAKRAGPMVGSSQ